MGAASSDFSAASAFGDVTADVGGGKSPPSERWRLCEVCWVSMVGCGPCDEAEPAGSVVGSAGGWLWPLADEVCGGGGLWLIADGGAAGSTGAGGARPSDGGGCLWLVADEEVALLAAGRGEELQGVVGQQGAWRPVLVALEQADPGSALGLPVGGMQDALEQAGRAVEVAVCGY